MNKVRSIVEIAAYTLGSIGGFGWAMYNHGYLIGGAVVVLAVMAFPELKRAVKDLTE